MLYSVIGFINLLCMQVLSAQSPAESGDLLLKILIPTGSVSGTLSVIWYYLIKQLTKQNQEQFQFALTQNQEQFDKALSQIKEQHKENLDEARRTNDKLFEVLKKDTEYKEILAGVLTELKNDMRQLIHKVK